MVLVHGWGMHSGVWEDVAEALVDDYRVTIVDLPGHGYSRQTPAGHTLRELSHVVAEHVPTRATWVGWSLGGMVAQRVAIDLPEHVLKLVLVASSPRFVRHHDWPHAVDFTTLHQFADSLDRDYRSTLKRFLALEVIGSDHAREQLRLLHSLVFQHGEPDTRALRDGLSILETEDLRSGFARISCPTLLLMGQRDNLVPGKAGGAMQDLLPMAQLHLFRHGGHAPFFSHPAEFSACLRAFLDG